MKTAALSAVALALLQLAAAQPHGRRHHRLAERAPAQEIVVVEENGVPVSSYTTTVPSSTPAPKVQNKAVANSGSTAGSGSGSGSSSGSSSGSTGSSSGMGMTYSPYNADSSCKSASQVKSDLETVNQAGYKLIRIYGTDCDQVENVYNAAKANGQKLYIGMDNKNVISNGAANSNGIQSDCKAIASGVKGDWSIVEAVAVGNEIVNGQLADANAVKSAVQTAKQNLSGYNGPVVAPDTFVAYYSNPQLYSASDYVAANCHAFYDTNTAADGAGKFVHDNYNDLVSGAKKNTGKDTKVIITETGWPTQGGTNGKAVPSKDNQNTAISGIKSQFSQANQQSNVILFTAFNDMWKQDTGATHGCEKYWGMLG